MPYPCSDFYFDIKFGDRLYSKEGKRVSASRFHQPKRDSINQKGGPPLGTTSMDLAVSSKILMMKKYLLMTNVSKCHDTQIL